MKKIFFDESGATGYNFLDPAQPIFSICSTDITPSEAEEILKTSFPTYKGDEFKFQNILGNSHETRLVNFAKILLPKIERIFSYSINKRFATLLKIIDFLVEPSIHSSGFDFYNNGYNIKYANYMYVGLSIIGGFKIFDQIITSYQTFSRNPSKGALDQMIMEFKSVKVICPDEVKPLIDLMINGAKVIEEYINIDDIKKTNDLHLSTMLALVGRWRQMSKEDFIVIYDDTASFRRHLDLWRSLTRSDADPFNFTLGDGTTVEFPLRVIDTVSVDSKTDYSIQLCDIIAGFITHKQKLEISSTPLRKTVRNALDMGLGELILDGIRPDLVFPDFIPPILRGADKIDLLSKTIK